MLTVKNIPRSLEWDTELAVVGSDKSVMTGFIESYSARVWWADDTYRSERHPAVTLIVANIKLSGMQLSG